MEGDPFVVSALVNNISFANILIDTGCLSYGLCDSNYARKHNLMRLRIQPREVLAFDGKVSASVDELAVVELDLEGHRESRVFMYITPIGHYDMILGMPWITAQDTRINGPKMEMLIRSSGTVVRSQEAFFNLQANIALPVHISATAFNLLSSRSRQKARLTSIRG